MRIYLAGKMLGVPDFNHDKFAYWTEILRAQGHTVFSPAEQDVLRYGEDYLLDFNRRLSYMDNFYWIIHFADAIAVIPDPPGIVRGKGTKAEIALGEALNLEIIYLDEKISLT